jgi:YVTN family beta-propeller protein
VIDPSSTYAYITDSAQNTVDVLDLQTDKWIGEIPAGSSPAGIDITPDGKTLIVCDSAAQTLTLIDTTTRTTNTIPTPRPADGAQYPLSVAMYGSDSAMLTLNYPGSGESPLYLLDLKTLRFTQVAKVGLDQLTSQTQLSRNSTYSVVGGAEGDISSGNYFTYQSGQFAGATSQEYLPGPTALDRSGNTMLVATQPGSTLVVSTARQRIAGTVKPANGDPNSSGVPAVEAGVAISPDGSTGYVVGPNSVEVLNLANSTVESTMDLPAESSDPVSDSSPGNHLVLAPNNSVLLVLRGSSVNVLQVG